MLLFFENALGEESVEKRIKVLLPIGQSVSISSVAREPRVG